MADQGKWFKLWCSSLDDTALEDLELSDWARWARFGAYIKSHGNAGEIEIKSPCRSIQNLWRVKSYREIIVVLVRLPNLMISTSPIQWPHGKLRPPTCEGEILCGKWCTDGRGNNYESAVVDTPHEEVVNLWEMKRSLFVSFINWHKYQDDLSSGRVVKLRLNETLQEEKRSRREGEEKRKENIPPNPPEFDFASLWDAYPKRLGRKNAERHFKATVKTEVDYTRIHLALVAYKGHVAGKDPQYIKNGDTWFNQWQDWVDYKETGGRNGTNVGKSIFVQAAERERAQQSAGDRKELSPGQIFARVRNLPHVPAEPGTSWGTGSPGHGRPVETLRANDSVAETSDRGQKP